MAGPGGTYCIDAGGSNTVVRVRRADGAERTWRTPSCAIATVGHEGAFAQLRGNLLRVEAEIGGSGRLRGCVASSSFPVAGEARPPETLVRAIAGSGCAGRVLLVNDVVPLLWSERLDGGGIVVNSGTGSVVLGRDSQRRLIKLGGHEHILSDAGSAYAIARKGLCAAVLASDRLGPKTDLEGRAEAFYGLTVRELGRRLAETVRPRAEVARFAPEVLDLAQSGDEAARSVTVAQAGLLADAAVEGHRRLGLDSTAAVVVSGGVLLGSPFYRSLLVAAMARAGVATAPIQLDSVEAALAFAGRLEADARHLTEAAGGLLITVG